MKATSFTYQPPTPGKAVLRYLILPVLSLALVGYLWGTRVDSLPDQVATHFGARGRADGFSSPTGFFLTSAVAILITTAVALAIGAMVKYAGPLGRVIGATAAGVSTLFAAITVETVHTQAGLTDTSTLVMPGSTVAVLLIIALPAGLLGYVLSAPSSKVEVTTDPLPSLDVPPGTALAFVHEVDFGLPFAALTGILLVVATVIGLATEPVAGLFLALAAVLTLSMQRIRVSGGARGVVARSWFGFPLRRIPLADIAGASALEQSAAELGGWGYRVTTTGSGISTGTGMTLRVHRKKGADWFCSMAEAPAAAATINALLKD